MLWSGVLVAIAVASVYLSYELVIVPRRAPDRIHELEEHKQQLESYVKISSTGTAERGSTLKQADALERKQQTTI